MIHRIFHQLLVIGVLLIAVSTQVIGIDFGTQFWKAALISPGKSFVIVQNSRSQRKTPNGISFIDGVRLFQSQGVSKKARYPKNTFTDLNQLLPILDNPKLELSNGNQYQILNETLVFEYQKDKQIKLQQLLGMIFKNIKSHASKQAGTEIKDCVITIPSNWGLAARTALVNGAYIGDLAVLSLINENTAAALNYAMTRNDQAPIYSIIFNLGSYNLQITLIKFYGYKDKAKNKTIQSVQILGHQLSNQVSGYKIDEIIASVIADGFNQKYKKNVQKNPRAWTKLIQKASDVKQTLSANKQANMYIEGFMDGIDLNMVISRAQIQNSPIYNAITQNLQNLLEKADISKHAITAVELIGGASRIPKIISKVTEYFPSAEVGTHINGDEAMALGAVLHAANMSVTFRVKDIHLYDGWHFPITLKITHGQQIIYNEVIFTARDPYWSKRQIELNHTDGDINIILSNQNEILKEYTTVNLSNWKNLYEVQSLTKPVVLKLHFVISSVAIVELKQIYLNINKNESTTKEIIDYVKQRIIYNNTQNQVKQEQTKPNEQNTEGDKDQVGDQPIQQNKQSSNDEQKNQQQSNTETTKQETIKQETKEESLNETESNSNKTQKKKKLPKYKTVTVKKNVTEYKEKVIKHNIKSQNGFNKYKRINKSQITDLGKIIRRFEKFQNNLKQKSKAKNQLESRLYDLRRNYDEKYMTVFSTQSQFENLKAVVEQELLWLEDNAYDGSKQDFEEHLQIVFKAYHPIYNRTMEYQNRGKTVNETIEYLGQVYQKAEQLNKSNPWVREKAEDLMKKVNETYQWYKKKLDQQEKLPLNTDPVFYNFQPIRKVEKLRDEYYLIKMIPRPKATKNLNPSSLTKQDVQQLIKQQKSKQKIDQKRLEELQELIRKKQKQTEQKNGQKKQTTDL